MMTVAQFIAKWRHVELKERSAAQEHFLDLCHLVDHPTPAEADSTGDSFCFEKGTAKHGGGNGFANVLPDHQLIVFAREDDAFFGLFHSHIHEVWALGQGTQLREKESGFRYTPTTCFETFPPPAPDEGKWSAIAAAAQALDTARNNWLGDRSDKTHTLTNLYNKRPQWLINAHAALDAAVAVAYGWPADLPDDTILERLLTLNLERAASH